MEQKETSEILNNLQDKVNQLSDKYPNISINELYKHIENIAIKTKIKTTLSKKLSSEDIENATALMIFLLTKI